MAKPDSHPLKYALRDQFLDSATQHGIRIYGPYVRDVLAPMKVGLNPYNQDADINLWVGSADDWKKFVSVNRHLEIAVDNHFPTQNSTTMAYEVFLMRHPVCRGKVHTSPREPPADFDIDDLICDDYDSAAGFELTGIRGPFTATTLLIQVKQRKFKVLNKDVAQSRIKELVDAGWKQDYELVDSLKIIEDSSRERLLEIAEISNKELNKLVSTFRSTPYGVADLPAAVKALAQEMLRLSAVVKGTLKLMDK